MAIYHMSAQVIGRSSGRSATAAAAYRSAEKIVDERTGEIHDYTKKSGVDYTKIMTPENCGKWAINRAELWNRVEQTEKRKDAQLAREINIAIPIELTLKQGRKLVIEYAQKNFIDKGMIADICVHHETGNNPHAHIMLSMREVTPEGFGQKVREWNTKEQLGKWREEWAHSCNMALEKAGEMARVDHRSLSAQGIDRVPTVHQGPKATGIERRGEESTVVKINDDIAEYNRQIEAIFQAQKEIAEINALLAEMQDSTLEKKEEFAYCFSINTSYKDVRAAFDERMESEHPGWKKEELRIRETKNATGYTGDSEHYFQGSLQLRFDKLAQYRNDALSTREQLDSVEYERESTNFLAFRKNNELDKTINNLRYKEKEQIERHNTLARQIGPYREGFELYKKHEEAFKQSPELKEFKERIYPEQIKRESAERERKHAAERERERSRGRGR